MYIPLITVKCQNGPLSSADKITMGEWIPSCPIVGFLVRGKWKVKLCIYGMCLAPACYDEGTGGMISE